MEWVTHHFEYFGLSCDIFRGAEVAVMLEPRTPNVGSLSQSEGAWALSVSYGPDAQLDTWLRRALSDSSAEVSVLERRAAKICDYPAERVVLKVVPPSSAVGHRLDAQGVQPASAESGGPFLLTAVGAVHRRTPFTAIFQRPFSDAPADADAEEHFFSSFRCQT